MAIIVRDGSRPAFKFDANGVVLDGAPVELLVRARLLERASNAVARIEIEGGVTPWVGTAFLVAPRLAITARYASEAGSKTKAWLNFASNPTTEEPRRVPVASIEHVHPFWQFAYLCLGEDPKIDPLMLAQAPDLHEIEERAIAVIGYSSFDQRNEEEPQSRIFGDVYDVKHVSTGRIVALEQGRPGAAPMLLHDASTLGGCGGAPLIDLETGEVLGIHHSGLYLRHNLALFAWLARGDPHWERLWAGDDAGRSRARPAPTPRSREIFSFEERLTIKDWLVEADVTDESSLAALFLGLDPELVGQIRSADRIGDRLAFALDYLNDAQMIFAGRPPLYYVLTNARRRRQYDPEAIAQMDVFLEKVRTPR